MKTKLTYLMLAVLLIGSLSFPAYAADISTPLVTTGFGTFFESGMYLDNINIGGYTYQQAYAVVNQLRTEKLAAFKVGIHIGMDKNYTILAKDIDWTSNTLILLDLLWENSKSLVPDYSSNRMQSTISYDQNKLDAIIDWIYEDATGGAKASDVLGFDPNTRKFIFNTDPEGYAIEKENLHNRICKAVGDLSLSNIKEIQVDIPAEKNTVGTLQELNEQYGLLSEYSTKTANVPNRNTNIMLAGNAISGTELKPGEVFSFNQIVGPTTVAKGYKEAGILVNGKPDTGMGGGICQVSSTLYNAVLDAGLTVVERHPHSAPVGYVPKNRDATVSMPYVDFRFQNSTDSNLYVIVDYDNKTLSVSLFGKKAK